MANTTWLGLSRTPAPEASLHRSRFGSLILTVALASAVSTSASAFDMRECPLDQVVFIDTWAEGAFEVSRVGTSFYYACQRQTGTEISSEPGEDCTGPYGRTYLEGRLNNTGQPVVATAIYSHDYSTAPCCGWEMNPGLAVAPQDREITWLEGEDILTLGSLSSAILEGEYGYLASLAPMAPLVCNSE